MEVTCPKCGNDIDYSEIVSQVTKGKKKSLSDKAKAARKTNMAKAREVLKQNKQQKGDEDYLDSLRVQVN